MTLVEFYAGVNERHKTYPKERYCQAAYNYLFDVRPDLANKVVGNANIDPYYINENNKVWENFMAWLESNW